MQANPAGKASILDLALRFLRRALAADFQRDRAADDERQQLAAVTPPVADPLAQDYVAWRRAALWIAGVLLAVGSIISLVEHRTVAETAAAEQLQPGQQAHGADWDQMVAMISERVGKGNLAIMDGLLEFLLFVKLAVAVLVMVAAWQWWRLRRSRSLTRWALLTSLVLPLLVAAWPWAQSLDFSHLEQEMGISKQIKQGVALAIAAQLTATITPKLIALFPGIIRSSMALKTLLPEAAAPGWLAVVFAPFLAGFLLLLLSFIGQVQGSYVLLAGVVALVCGPVIYLRRAAQLVRPHRAEEIADTVGAVRRTTALTNGIGVVLLVWFLFDFDELTWMQAIHLLLEAAGGIFLTIVAISDITLALLAYSQRQNVEFFGSDLRTSYEQRLQALAGAGLTDVESALGVKDLDGLQQLRRGSPS